VIEDDENDEDDDDDEHQNRQEDEDEVETKQVIEDDDQEEVCRRLRSRRSCRRRRRSRRDIEEDDDQEEDEEKKKYGTQKAIPATASKKAKTQQKIVKEHRLLRLKNFTSQRMAQRHEVMPWGARSGFAKGRNPKVETNCSGSSVGVAKSIHPWHGLRGHVERESKEEFAGASSSQRESRLEQVKALCGGRGGRLADLDV
jgi:hypothetical protein